ncbi:MAG: sigma-70 family RNA polymerase sigma factor [Verrucomicrobiaceae bacterium]|nr:sigma-70 family RNA polymerase sigma factor [Verrucomicrobiaceae bacterium]
MSSADTTFHAADFEFAQDLLAGDEGAWLRFDAEYTPAIAQRLRGMGASDADADEVQGLVIERLWTRQKLASYTGQGPLMGFVRTTASNAWLEYLRKHRREVHASTLAGEDEEGDAMDRIAGEKNDAPQESPLAELLRDALKFALDRADAEALLIMRLSLLQDIKQRDLCDIWGGVHEGTISAKKKQVMTQIRDDTLGYVAEREPSLQITWQELLEACGEGAEAILGPAGE